MTPSEMMQKIETLTAEIDYSERTVKLLSGFEELHREASRDPRFDSATRDTHADISRAMGFEIQDALSMAKEMKTTRKHLQLVLSATTVGQAYSDADSCQAASLWPNLPTD